MNNIPPFLQRLDLDVDADERAIKRAYARELKLIDQTTEAARFQELRENYETALSWKRHSLYEANADAASTSTSNSADVTPSAVTAQPSAIEADLSTVFPQPVASNDANDANDANRVEPEASSANENLRLADALFFEFQERFQLTIATNKTPDEATIKAVLDQSIHAADMDNFIVREIFEARIVDLLLSGWRPGHEVLLVVAGTSFQWLVDRSRLQRLGRIGYILDQAYTEREIFFQQSDATRDLCRKAITRFRNPQRPKISELLELLPVIEKILEVYPYLMPVIIDSHQLQVWQRWDSEIPSWRRINPQSWLIKVNNKLPKISLLTPWRVAWLLFIVIKIYFFSR